MKKWLLESLIPAVLAVSILAAISFTAGTFAAYGFARALSNVVVVSVIDKSKLQEQPDDNR